MMMLSIGLLRVNALEGGPVVVVSELGELVEDVDSNGGKLVIFRST